MNIIIWIFLIFIILYNISFFVLKPIFLYFLNKKSHIKFTLTSLGCILYLCKDLELEIYEKSREDDVNEQGKFVDNDFNGSGGLKNLNGDSLGSENANALNALQSSTDVNNEGVPTCPIQKSSSISAHIPRESNLIHESVNRILSIKIGRIRFILFQGGKFITLSLENIKVEQWKNQKLVGNSNCKVDIMNSPQVNDIQHLKNQTKNSINSVLSNIKLPWFVKNIIAPYFQIVFQNFEYSLENETKSALTVKGEKISLKLRNELNKNICATLLLSQAHIILQREYHSKKELLPVCKSNSIELNLIGTIEGTTLKHVSVGITSNIIDAWSSPSINSILKHFFQDKKGGNITKKKEQFELKRSLKQKLANFPIGVLIKATITLCNLQIETIEQHPPFFIESKLIDIEVESKCISERANIVCKCDSIQSEVGTEVGENPMLSFLNWKFDTTVSFSENKTEFDVQSRIGKFFSRVSPSRVQWFKTIAKLTHDKKMMQNISSDKKIDTKKDGPLFGAKMKFSIDEAITHICNSQDMEVATLTSNGVNTLVTIDKAVTNVSETTSEVQLLLGKLLLSCRDHVKLQPSLEEVDNKTFCKIGEYPLILSSCTLTLSTNSTASKLQIEFGHILAGIAQVFLNDIVTIYNAYIPLFEKVKQEHQVIIIKKEEKAKKPLHINIVSNSSRFYAIGTDCVISLKFAALKCLVVNQLVTILSESCKLHVNTLLKSNNARKFESLAIQKIAILIDKVKGLQISSSQVKTNWNVPVHLCIEKYIKELIVFSEHFNVPKSKKRFPNEKKAKLPISIKCNNIQLCAEFTPKANFSATVFTVYTKDLLNCPITITDIGVLICGTKIATIESTTLLLNQHPQMHNYSNSFAELHKQVINPTVAIDNSKEKVIYMTIKILNPIISIPHQYPLGDIINEIKGAKKVIMPKKEREPGANKGRILPGLPRLYVQVSNLSFEMKDNVIEETLIIHKRLWKQNATEHEERVSLLEKQIQDGAIPHDRIEEVRKRLMEVNAQEYIKNINDYIKKYKKPGMVNCTVKEITCDIFRKSNLRTYDDAIVFMQSIDNPPFPKDDDGNIKDFGIIAAMSMNINIKKIDVSLRNHPYSMFQSESISVHTTVIPMFVYGIPGINTLTKYVDVGFGEIVAIPASLTGGVRMFTDTTCNLHGSSILYGPMYDPILQDILKFVKNFVPKSGTNPSPPLKWWDKLRLMLHTQLKLTLTNTNAKIVIGVDPYDQTDSLEIQIKNIRTSLKENRANIHIGGGSITYNPSLVDFPIAEIPDVCITTSLVFENGLENPNNYFFPIVIPKAMKTINDVNLFKDKIDLYKDWRMTGYSIDLNVVFSSGPLQGASLANPTVMCNPIACSWIIEFTKFMTKKSFQVIPTKISKRESEHNISLSQLKKAFNVNIRVNGLNVIWSNGYNQNDILHVTAKYLVYIRKEERDHTEEINSSYNSDVKKPKIIVKESSIETNDLTLKVYSYDLKSETLYKYSKRHAFLGNHMLSIGKVVYKANDRSDILPSGLEELENYSTFLLAYDMHLIWTSALRDALYQWIDLVQQFIFTTKNVVGNRAAKIGTKLPDIHSIPPSPKSPATPQSEKGIELIEEILNQSKNKTSEPPKENIDKFMGIGLVRPKYGLLGDENHEALMFNSPTGLILLQNIKQSISKHKRLELFIVLHTTTVYWVDSIKYQLSRCWPLLEEPKKSNPFPVAIDTSNFIVHYVEDKSGQYPRKNLRMGFPNLDLHFTSTQIRAFIDVISNVLVPKKKGPKLVLEDQKQTFTLMGKLAPDQWENIRQLKQLCKQIRTEIRNDIYNMNQMQRSYKNGEKELLTTIHILEGKIESKKSRFHVLKEALQKAATKALSQEKETSCQPDFKIDMEFFNVTLNLKDSHDKPFTVVSLMNFHGIIVKNTDYSAYHTFSVHEIRADNLLPNPIYTHIIEPVTKNEHQVLTDNDECISVTVNKSSPIGGMNGFDHFQITLAPIALRFTYDLYRKLWSYLFPNVKIGVDDDVPKKKKGSKKIVNDELHDAISDAFLQGYVDTMKSRAAQRKIFKYIRFDEAELYLSFRGASDDRAPALMNFVSSFDETRVHIRPLTYYSETWSWTELAERLKRDIALESLQHILPQSMKSLSLNKVKNIQEWLRSSLKISNTPKVLTSDAKERGSGKINSAYKLDQSIQEKQRAVMKKTGEAHHRDKLKTVLLLGDKTIGHGGKQLLGHEYKSQIEIALDSNDVSKEDQTLDENLFDELINSNPQDNED